MYSAAVRTARGWLQAIPISVSGRNCLSIGCGEVGFSVSGQVLIDGKPLYWGWLTLVPHDLNLPTVTSYMGWNNLGKFEIGEKSGPVPGKYHAEVRRVAKDFSDKTSGSYSMEDAELLPTSGRPSISLDITEGENEINIDVKS